MRVRRILAKVMAMGLSLGVWAVAPLAAAPGMATTSESGAGGRKAGPCAPGAGAFPLSRNSGATIRIGDGTDPEKARSVIVFRPPAGETGWASRRLLSRFDLALSPVGPTLENTGAVCPGPRS